MEGQRDLASTDSSVGESVSQSLGIQRMQATQQAHRTTNFLIDNILRPDFGCKNELSLNLREKAQSSGRGGGHPVLVSPFHWTPCLDSSCKSDSTSSSTTSAASPKKRSNDGGTSAVVSVEYSEGLKSEETDAENSASSLVVMNRAGTRTPESQPLLWPAWVYCTRYSDRPSSGKAINSLTDSSQKGEMLLRNRIFNSNFIAIAYFTLVVT